jgi:hypothetical protein
MDGETATVDEPFDTDDGPLDSPPLHPNCRCTVVLDVPKRKARGDRG